MTERIDVQLVNDGFPLVPGPSTVSSVESVFVRAGQNPQTGTTGVRTRMDRG
jgi:hypothetical protein